MPRIDELSSAYTLLSLEDIDFTTFHASTAMDDEDPQMSVRAGTSTNGPGYEVEFTLVASGFGVEYEVGVLVQYLVDDEDEAGVEWAEGVEREFLNTSALVTAIPYLREALTSLGSRMRSRVPMLPIVGPHAPLPEEMQLNPMPDAG